MFFLTTNSGASSASNGVWLDRPRTINSGSLTKLYIGIRGFNTSTSWVQMEEGNTATPYTPYQNLNGPVFTVKKWTTTLVNNQYVSPYGSYGYVEVPASDVTRYGEVISASALNDATAPMPCAIAKQTNGTYRIILVSNTSNKNMTVKVVHCKGIINEVN